MAIWLANISRRDQVRAPAQFSVSRKTSSVVSYQPCCFTPNKLTAYAKWPSILNQLMVFVVVVVFPLIIRLFFFSGSLDFEAWGC